MFPLIGGLLSGAMNMFGGAMTNQQSAANVAAQNQAQMAQTQQQEQFQEQMSNTAYQRASADMKAAGLNPMMMFGSGSAASTPSGSAAQIARPDFKSPLSSVGDVVNSTVSNAVAMKQLDKMSDEMANLRTTNELIGAQVDKARADANLTDVQRANLNIISTMLTNQATTARNQMSLDPTLRAAADKASLLGKSAGDVLQPISSLIGSATGVKRLFSPFWP